MLQPRSRSPTFSRLKKRKMSGLRYFLREIAEGNKRGSLLESPTTKAQSKVSAFVLEETYQASNSDPLAWWKTQGGAYL